MIYGYDMQLSEVYTESGTAASDKTGKKVIPYMDVY